MLNLEVVRNREEKAEQTRRRALDDADADADADGDETLDSTPASAAMTAQNSTAGAGAVLDPTAAAFVPGGGGGGTEGEEDVEMGDGEVAAGSQEAEGGEAGEGSIEEGEM